jgi:hypothetical protein
MHELSRQRLSNHERRRGRRRHLLVLVVIVGRSVGEEQSGRPDARIITLLSLFRPSECRFLGACVARTHEQASQLVPRASMPSMESTECNFWTEKLGFHAAFDNMITQSRCLRKSLWSYKPRPGKDRTIEYESHYGC